MIGAGGIYASIEIMFALWGDVWIGMEHLATLVQAWVGPLVYFFEDEADAGL